MLTDTFIITATSNIWTTVKEVLPSLCTVLVAMISTFFAYKVTVKMANKSQNAIEISTLKKKLEEFYYPTLLLCETNLHLFNAFSQPKLVKEPNFSTLLALLRDEEFTGNDLLILEKIINNDIKLNNLIFEKSDNIDDVLLISDLAKASAHISIIVMAYKKELIGEPDRFINYTYPKNLSNNLKNKIININKKIEELK